MNRRDHDIRVLEHGSIRTLRIGHTDQSSMYLDAPFDTDFDYPGYLHLCVAVVPDAKRALIIGLGGATVVKRMWRDYPPLRIDAIESEPLVAELARTHFALPEDERIAVHVGDGRKFLEDSAHRYDFVIVDAFQDEHVPTHLLTREFQTSVLDRLIEDGVLAYNFHGSVTGDRSKPFRRLYRTLKDTFSRVWAFPVDLSSGGSSGDHREIIVLATNSALSTDDLLCRIADRVDGRVSVPAFHLYGADLYRVPLRFGDVAPYHDSD